MRSVISLVERVDVGVERARRRAAVDELQDRGLDLDDSPASSISRRMPT
jgi:hypothetical protein